MPVIGFLNAASRDQFDHLVRAFHLGLNERGYVEGRNVAIEYRWADNQYDRLPGLAEDLVHRRATVITTGSATLAALAAKAATTTIPIVFLTVSDPVELGFVTSLNRPGGNLTGVTTLNVEMGPKRLEVLHELLPAATIVGALVNPINYSVVIEAEMRRVQAAARTLGLKPVHILQASTERDLDDAFSSGAGDGVCALRLVAAEGDIIAGKLVAHDHDVVLGIHQRRPKTTGMAVLPRDDFPSCCWSKRPRDKPSQPRSFHRGLQHWPQRTERCASVS